MASKAETEQQLIFRTGRLDRAGSQDGFTLLEIVCVLAVVGLLAAVLLPKIPLGTSRPRLEAFAIATASLLVSDRSAAIRRHMEIFTGIDTPTHSLRSGATGRVVRIPDDVVFDAVLPMLCNRHPSFSTIGFLPSGMSCGGTIVLTRLGAGYEIRVNWLTGGVEVVSRSAL